MAFNGNTTFAFNIHIIQYLILFFTFGNGMRVFKKTVGKGTFTVVDMGDNAEIADVFHSKKKRANIGKIEGEMPLKLTITQN
jgi:hypothetical protein